MEKRSWNKIIKQEFESMDKSEQDDWAELREIVNKRHLGKK